MFREMARWKKDGANIRRSAKATFQKPTKLKEPSKIFTCSMSDFFLPEADAWRDEAWQIIKSTPQHTYQILTKRPERILECLPSDWGIDYQHVWIGVSAENQQTWDERVAYLSKVPVSVRFVSAEPLLEYISFTDKMGSDEEWCVIDWVIIGGESGNNTGMHRYRPTDTDWIHLLSYCCELWEVPYFIKQLGTSLAKELGLKGDRHGKDISQFPKEYQVRQFPTPKPHRLLTEASSAVSSAMPKIAE